MQPYTRDAVQTMVAKDHQASQELLSLLEQETACIKTHDYDGVKNILKAKAPLLTQLQQHAELRKEWLLSLYQITDETYWKQLLASFEDAKVNQQWQETNDVIHRCKEINETNGLLITRGQKTYSQLLNILKGGEKQSGLYNEKGNHANQTSTFTSTKA